MPDIFLSYSRKDSAFMQTLRDHLRGQGFDVWTDESLESGTPAWTFAIDKEIRNSKAMVVILSPDSRDSEWVEKELALADLCDIPIFALLYRGDFSTAVPFRLVSAQIDNYSVHGQTAIGKLTIALQRRLGNPITISIPVPLPPKDLYMLTVAKLGTADYRTINEALKVASEGATIKVRPGLYRESIILDKNIEILGEGKRDDIILESTENHCILMQTEYAAVRGLTVRLRTNGSGQNLVGIGIPQGRLVIEDCDVTSDCLSGIEIASEQSEGVIRRCRIHDTKTNGVSVYENSTGLIEDCDIWGNSLSGIQISSSANFTVRECRIHDGKTTGIVIQENGTAFIDNCDIWGNLYVGIEIKDGGNPTVRRSRIIENDQAGVYAHDNAKGIIEDSDLHGNGAKSTFKLKSVFGSRGKNRFEVEIDTTGAFALDDTSQITRRNNQERLSDDDS